MRSLKYLLLLLILITQLSEAQERRLRADSIPDPAAGQRSLSDTIPARPAPVDSIQVVSNGIETTIKYYAEDSIITRTSTNVTYLYGKAYILYGDVKLEAAQITIDRDNNELKANGVQDSTGSWIGLPVFQDGGQTYETREIRYNFETKRAKITGVATQQQDGYLAGDVVKRNEDGSAFISGGKFIPCPSPTATTYIKSNKIKIIPGKQVITGPFLLYVGGIPTPLGLPFGFFPDTQETTSGLIFPKFKQEQRRGIGLEELGYYFVWNDHIHTAISTDIFSKGSFAVRALNTYKKRYRYGGSFQFNYSSNKSSITDEASFDSQDFWVSWRHTPESRGRGRFSASVNAGSSTFNQNNFSNTNFNRNVRSEFRSNISYSSSIRGLPITYSINARHTQNVNTGVLNVSLPEFSAAMSRQYPFKGSKLEILKRLNVAWTFNMRNTVTNVVTPFSTSFDVVGGITEADTIPVQFGRLSELLDNAQNGARHTIPISTSFPFLGVFNLTPSINIQELWYLEERTYAYDETEQAVRVGTNNGFSRASTYSANIGLSTQLYGFYSFRNSSRIERIRHVMTPTIGFSYSPDYSDEKFGYYVNQRIDSAGNTRLLSVYDGFVFGSPRLGESASMSIGITNNFEAKVKSDTAEARKIPIIENLTFNTSYNFLADSFKLAPLNFSARTSLFNKKLSINAGMVIDPYQYEDDGEGNIRRTPQLAWRANQGLGRITSARFALSTSLNSRASSSPPPTARNQIDSGFNLEETGAFGSINDGGTTPVSRRVSTTYFDPNDYVDVNVPWNLRLNYDFNYTNPISGSRTRQSVKVYGQIDLTPKWKITGNTGYDIEMKEFTQTSLGIWRDLGCWEMRANWVPFGRFTSYTIDIQIKASALKDLKISRRRSFFDN